MKFQHFSSHHIMIAILSKLLGLLWKSSLWIIGLMAWVRFSACIVFFGHVSVFSGLCIYFYHHQKLLRSFWTNSYFTTLNYLTLTLPTTRFSSPRSRPRLWQPLGTVYGEEENCVCVFGGKVWTSSVGLCIYLSFYLTDERKGHTVHTGRWEDEEEERGVKMKYPAGSQTAAGEAGGCP